MIHNRRIVLLPEAPLRLKHFEPLARDVCCLSASKVSACLHRDKRISHDRRSHHSQKKRLQLHRSLHASFTKNVRVTSPLRECDRSFGSQSAGKAGPLVHVESSLRSIQLRSNLLHLTSKLLVIEKDKSVSFIFRGKE